MNKVQVKRLLNVAVALRDAAKARKKFSMKKYVFGDHCEVKTVFKDGRYISYNREENFCGTPACALGHYAARTDLQRLLKISILKDYQGGKYATMDSFGSKSGSGWGMESVMDHFGIDSREFEELFDPDGCGNAKTPLQAAKYIEKFVKDKQSKQI